MLNAAERLLFRPARLDNLPVEVWVEQSVEVYLPEPQRARP
jgi:hypothetical protein